MSEVRPWIGAYVSVALFETARPLTVIDCSRRWDKNPLFFKIDDWNYEPSPQERTEAVWSHIDKAFAEPMSRSDDQADYAPLKFWPSSSSTPGPMASFIRATSGRTASTSCCSTPLLPS